MLLREAWQGSNRGIAWMSALVAAAHVLLTEFSGQPTWPLNPAGLLQLPADLLLPVHHHPAGTHAPDLAQLRERFPGPLPLVGSLPGIHRRLLPAGKQTLQGWRSFPQPARCVSLYPILS